MNSANIKTNEKFVSTIIRTIEKKINRKLNQSEEDMVINLIKNAPDDYFYKLSLEEVVILLSNKAYQSIIKKYNVPDMHELMKRIIDPSEKADDDDDLPLNQVAECDDEEIPDMNIKTIFGYDNIASIIKLARRPVNSVNRAFICLDTRYRSLENDGTKYFSWAYSKTTKRDQGFFNNINKIRDIVSIRIAPFNMPINSSNINEYELITTAIDEFKTNSIISQENRYYHFIGEITSNANNKLKITSRNFNDATYKFNNPITVLNTITLSFGNPMERIVFDKDRLYGKITYGNPTIITFDETHNVPSNTLIYLSNFTTNNNEYYSDIISNMNLENGNLNTFINNNSFSLNIDTSSIFFNLIGTIASPSAILSGEINVIKNSNIVTGNGTLFSIDFVIGDYIQIISGSSTAFKIANIIDNTSLVIETNYTGATGKYSYRKTSKKIIGSGTSFTTELNIGDGLEIVDGVTDKTYIVESIESDSELTLKNPYIGLVGSGFNINKNNSISDSWEFYFGSKRMFINLEIEYLSSPNTN